MKKHHLLLIVCFLVSNTLFSQNDRIHIYFQNNSSNAEIRYPDKPQEGIFSANKIYTPGIGFQYDIYRGFINSSIRVGYTLKGLRLPFGIQEIGPGGQIVLLETDLYDKFHFFVFDVLFSYDLFKQKSSTPYVIAGVQNGFVLAKSTQNFQSFFEGTNSYQEDLQGYESYTLGGILGVGYNIRDILSLEVSANKDLLGIIRRSDVKVKNVLFSFNLIINPNKLLNAD